MNDTATAADATRPADQTRKPVLQVTGGAKIYGGVHAIEGIDRKSVV